MPHNWISWPLFFFIPFFLLKGYFPYLFPASLSLASSFDFLKSLLQSVSKLPRHWKKREWWKWIKGKIELKNNGKKLGINCLFTWYHLPRQTRPTEGPLIMKTKEFGEERNNQETIIGWIAVCLNETYRYGKEDVKFALSFTWDEETTWITDNFLTSHADIFRASSRVFELRTSACEAYGFEPKHPTIMAGRLTSALEGVHDELRYLIWWLFWIAY